MAEADVTYTDVKFNRKTARENVSSSGDTTYSEVRISPREQPVSTNCSSDVQQGGWSRRSKVTLEQVVLLVLTFLLVAALIALGVTNFINYKTQASLKEENEALRRNVSVQQSCTSPAPPASCPPPETQNRTCVKCGAGWEEHGGRCYNFSSTKSSWTNSRRSCRDVGGDLVKIDSREEQEFLEKKLRDKMVEAEDKFWIGLTDSETEGRWLWVDRSPLKKSWRYWSGDEPDNWTGENLSGEDCVRMGEKGGAEDLKCWFDRSCDDPNRSICEKPAETSSCVCVSSSVQSRIRKKQPDWF